MAEGRLGDHVRRHTVGVLAGECDSKIDDVSACLLDGLGGLTEHLVNIRHLFDGLQRFERVLHVGHGLLHALGRLLVTKRGRLFFLFVRGCPCGPRGSRGSRGPRGSHGPRGPRGPHGPLAPRGPRGASSDHGRLGALRVCPRLWCFPPLTLRCRRVFHHVLWCPSGPGHARGVLWKGRRIEQILGAQILLQQGRLERRRPAVVAQARPVRRRRRHDGHGGGGEKLGHSFRTGLFANHVKKKEEERRALARSNECPSKNDKGCLASVYLPSFSEACSLRLLTFAGLVRPPTVNNYTPALLPCSLLEIYMESCHTKGTSGIEI